MRPAQMRGTFGENDFQRGAHHLRRAGMRCHHRTVAPPDHDVKMDCGRAVGFGDVAEQGRDFDLDVVARVTGMAPGIVLDALEADHAP